MEGHMIESRKPNRAQTEQKQRRRLIAVGRRQNGRWKVRTSLWRYLAETAISR
jgi:hypothetical protein